MGKRGRLSQRGAYRYRSSGEKGRVRAYKTFLEEGDDEGEHGRRRRHTVQPGGAAGKCAASAAIILNRVTHGAAGGARFGAHIVAVGGITQTGRASGGLEGGRELSVDQVRLIDKTIREGRRRADLDVNEADLPGRDRSHAGSDIHPSRAGNTRMSRVSNASRHVTAATA